MGKTILFTMLSIVFYFCLYFLTLRIINYYESLKTFSINSFVSFIIIIVIVIFLGIIIRKTMFNNSTDRSLFTIVFVAGFILYLIVIFVKYIQ